MAIKNLTPHAIHIIRNIVGNDAVVRTIEPFGIVARAEQKDEPAGIVDGIDCVRSVFGKPIDLPDFNPLSGYDADGKYAGNYYIVSFITAQAAIASGRDCCDLLLTSGLVRDAQGRIIGCRQFARVY